LAGLSIRQVVDTGEKFIGGVVDTGDKFKAFWLFLTGINDQFKFRPFGYR
jgi:hypothetical protein